MRAEGLPATCAEVCRHEAPSSAFAANCAGEKFFSNLQRWSTPMDEDEAGSAEQDKKNGSRRPQE